MKAMLSFLIARDMMHQNQWMVVLEKLSVSAAFPTPNRFTQSRGNQDVNYTYFATDIDDAPLPKGRFMHGNSIDGKGVFRLGLSATCRNWTIRSRCARTIETSNWYAIAVCKKRQVVP